MRKLDNKGFAITGILYTLFILFILLMFSILNGLQTKKQMLERSTVKLEESFKLKDVTNDSNIGIEKALTEGKALTTGKYSFEISSNINLLFGLDNVENVTDSNNRAIYSVKNKKVTVTSKKDDGYIFINAYAYLEKSKTYTFSCDTAGNWGGNGNDTVEAFFMLDGKYDTYYHMSNKKNFKFTPNQTGQYTLRLDVNKKGKTYTFENLTITSDDGTAIAFTYLTKGKDLAKDKITFIPKDWNDYKNNYEFKLTKIESFESED